MEIKKSKYSETWIDKQIEDIVDKLVFPIMAQEHIYRVNKIMRVVCWLFIIFSQAISVMRMQTYPLVAEACQNYIFFSMLALFIVAEESYKAGRDCRRRICRDCVKAISDMLTGFFLLKEMYHHQDMIQDTLMQLQDDDREALILRYRKRYNNPDFVKGGIVDFTNLDKQAEKYVNAVEQFKSFCREVEII